MAFKYDPRVPQTGWRRRWLRCRIHLAWWRPEEECQMRVVHVMTHRGWKHPVRVGSSCAKFMSKWGGWRDFFKYLLKPARAWQWDLIWFLLVAAFILLVIYFFVS
jgi:hypothetical protein